ncbi:hypothetical protein FPV67DRAFT_221908 [Lyophyllum atratum]|nr:hypothetical protein FPV67DRAFT_221908 [Lyophyllum atratum]
MSDRVCAKCNKADATKLCSRCRDTAYCSVECQNEAWRDHKPDCIPELVHGITINCNCDRRDRALFQRVEIRANHPIHSFGESPSVSKVIKLPLVIYRHTREPWMKRGELTDDASLDNQIATYLMIDKINGFAPPEYQKQVGTITVMRKDGKPLTPESIETIWMYHDHLLDLFGDEPYIARKAMNQAAFNRYCRGYKDERLLNGHDSFRDMEVPL